MNVLSPKNTHADSIEFMQCFEILFQERYYCMFSSLEKGCGVYRAIPASRSDPSLIPYPLQQPAVSVRFGPHFRLLQAWAVIHRFAWQYHLVTTPFKFVTCCKSNLVICRDYNPRWVSLSHSGLYGLYPLPPPPPLKTRIYKKTDLSSQVSQGLEKHEIMFWKINAPNVVLAISAIKCPSINKRVSVGSQTDKT